MVNNEKDNKHKLIAIKHFDEAIKNIKPGLVDLEELAKKTVGFSGADLDGLVREAALLALKEGNLKPVPVKKKHFNEILKKMHPSIGEETEQAYDEFQESYSAYKPTYVG